MQILSHPMLVSLLIGGLMAAASFLLNNWCIKKWGNIAFVTTGPVVEEVCKSYISWYLGSYLVLTHIAFGTIEGIYDLITSRYGVKGCILSIGGHSLFGFVTAAVWFLTGVIHWGVAAACMVHVSYNFWMVYHFTNNK